MKILQKHSQNLNKKFINFLLPIDINASDEEHLLNMFLHHNEESSQQIKENEPPLEKLSEIIKELDADGRNAVRKILDNLSEDKVCIGPISRESSLPEKKMTFREYYEKFCKMSPEDIQQKQSEDPDFDIDSPMCIFF